MRERADVALVRSVACLLIVNYHMSRLDIPGASVFSKGGFVGNTVFFALSGYLLAVSSLGKTVDSAWLKRRLLRIYPALLISIVLIIGISVLAGLEKTFYFMDVFLTSVGLQYYFGISSLGEHLWFVSVLLACYVLFRPTRHLVEHRFRSLVFGWICVFIAVALLTPSIALEPAAGERDLYARITAEVPLRFLYHYGIFFAAMWYGLNESRVLLRVKSAGLMWRAGAFAIFGGVYAVLLSIRGQSFVLSTLSVVAAACCAIALMATLSALPGRLGRTEGLFWFLASVSYEIYLIHFVVIDVADKYLSGLVSIPFVFGGTILLAFLINRWSASLTHRGLEFLERMSTSTRFARK